MLHISPEKTKKHAAHDKQNVLSEKISSTSCAMTSENGGHAAIDRGAAYFELRAAPSGLKPVAAARPRSNLPRIRCFKHNQVRGGHKHKCARGGETISSDAAAHHSSCDCRVLKCGAAAAHRNTLQHTATHCNTPEAVAADAAVHHSTIDLDSTISPQLTLLASKLARKGPLINGKMTP